MNKMAKHDVKIGDVLKIGGTKLHIDRIGDSVAGSTRRVGESSGSLQETSAPFACPICCKDLSGLNGALQNKHVNDCLDGPQTEGGVASNNASFVASVVQMLLCDRSAAEPRRSDIKGTPTVSKCVCGENLALMSVRSRRGILTA